MQRKIGPQRLFKPGRGQTGHDCNEFISLKQLATQEPRIKWLAQRGHCAERRSALKLGRSHEPLSRRISKHVRPSMAAGSEEYLMNALFRHDFEPPASFLASHIAGNHLGLNRDEYDS